MKNPRKQTFEESKKTIKPYTSLPSKKTKCENHNYEKREDNFEHVFFQCTKCGSL